jgi:hypothetical protein
MPGCFRIVSTCRERMHILQDMLAYADCAYDTAPIGCDPQAHMQDKTATAEAASLILLKCRQCRDEARQRKKVEPRRTLQTMTLATERYQSIGETHEHVATDHTRTKVERIIHNILQQSSIRPPTKSKDVSARTVPHS